MSNTKSSERKPMSTEEMSRPSCDGSWTCPAPVHVHGCYNDPFGPCDEPAAHSQDQLLCIQTPANDSEAVATWWCDGFETAMAQHLAPNPEYAHDWLEEYQTRVRIHTLEGIQRAFAGEDSLEWCRTSTTAQISLAQVMEYLDDLINEAKGDAEPSA